MTSFAVTWDYRCPFARNAHEHVLAGLADGADWDVTFVPFSLGQVHVEEGQPDIWDRPENETGLLALQVGTVVRDTVPDGLPTACTTTSSPPATTRASTCGSATSCARSSTRHGVDADAVFAAIDDGGALDIVRKEHEAAAPDHTVWGVPTFILGDEAVFVRVMDRPGTDGAHARRTDRPGRGPAGGLPELNEFKHTSIKR